LKTERCSVLSSGVVSVARGPSTGLGRSYEHSGAVGKDRMCDRMRGRSYAVLDAWFRVSDLPKQTPLFNGKAFLPVLLGLSTGTTHRLTRLQVYLLIYTCALKQPTYCSLRITYLTLLVKVQS
jgi:hypothetical protein